MPIISGSAGSGAASVDGWTGDSYTWVFVSATSFKVVGVDVTATFTKGTRLKLTQSAAVKYFAVVASTFSTDTTVTITGGSDYSLANAAITANAYSYAANPQGWPTWFAYTPTSSLGFTGALTITTAQFQVVGALCICDIWMSGTSNNTTSPFRLLMPIAGRAGSANGYAACRITDNGVLLTAPGTVFSNNSGSGSETEFAIGRDAAGTAYTGSGTKGTVFTVAYPI